MDLKTKNKPKPKAKTKPKQNGKKKEQNPGPAWRIHNGTILGSVCWILESPRELLKGKKKFPAQWEFLWKTPSNGRFKRCIEIARNAKSPLLQWLSSCLLHEIIQVPSLSLLGLAHPAWPIPPTKALACALAFTPASRRTLELPTVAPRGWPTPSLGNCERYKLFWWRWLLRFALPFGHLYELNHLLSKRLGHTGWSLYEYKNLLLTK